MAIDGAGGADVVRHALEHLGRGDDALAEQAALADELLLDARQLLIRHLDAHVAAGDHDAGALGEDVLDVVDTGLIFDLGDDGDVPAAVAEIADVANAVYDGTSAVMLSGESAAGKYPVKTVQTMAEIVEETEKHIDYETLFRKEEFQIKNMVDAISHATCCMACDIGAKTIVVSSLSGATVRMVSRFRVPVDIVGMATNERVWYRLALSWGVQPILCEETFTSTDVLFYNALHAAKKAMHLHKGDNIVMTAGNTNGASGNTNLIKVETI